MRRRLVALLVLAPLLAACGASTRATVAAMCARITGATGDMLNRCAGLPRDAFDLGQRPRLAADCEARAAAVANGHATYDPAKAKACLAELRSAACSKQRGAHDPCDGWITGTVKDGQPCDRSIDCAAASYCTSITGATCPGTCAPRPKAGADCSKGQPCVAGTVCRLGVCAALPGPGDACTGTGGTACGPGLHCAVPSGQATGICTPAKAEGAACDSSDQCAWYDGCYGGVCAPIGSGDSVCYAGRDCGEGLYCDQGLCVEDPRVGGRCGIVQQQPVPCLGSYCKPDGPGASVGTCAAYAGAGDACDPGTAGMCGTLACAASTGTCVDACAEQGQAGADGGTVGGGDGGRPGGDGGTVDGGTVVGGDGGMVTGDGGTDGGPPGGDGGSVGGGDGGIGTGDGGTDGGTSGGDGGTTCPPSAPDTCNGQCVDLSPLRSGLVAYYPFDGNGHDATGHGHDASARLNVETVPGKLGPAFQFNGSNSDIRLSGSNVLNGPRTFCAWFRQESVTGYGLPIVEGGVQGAADIVGVNASQVNVGTCSYGSNVLFWDHWIHACMVTNNLPAAPGAWHFGCWAMNGSTFTEFLDGQAISHTSSSVYTYDIGSMNIGADPIGGTVARASFQGALDEVGIWSRALSVSEMQTLYASGGGCALEQPQTCALGTCPVEIVAAGQNGPTGVAVDATTVFWTDNGSGEVMAMPIGGGSPQTIASGQAGPLGIATDGTNVYWTNRQGGQVMAVPVTGGTPRVLASGQAQPTGIATDGTEVYWTNAQGGQVEAIARAGGTPAPLATGEPSPVAIAVDAQRVYWADTGGSGDVMEVSKGGGSPTALATGIYSTSIAVDATSVYYGRHDGRWVEVPKGGGSQVVLTPNDTYIGYGVATDGTHVFWTDGQTKAVFALPVTGGTPVMIAPPAGAPTPEGIAVGAHNVYWVDHDTNGSVMRVQK